MRLWVVGRLTMDVEGGGCEWELLGVYGTEEKALARCTTPLDFLGPTDLDRDLPDERVEWPGAYYPHATAETVAAYWAQGGTVS